MNIGRLAPWYRWIEYAAFGRALEKRRFAFLPRLATARRVLIPGEGDGRTLAQLLSINATARFEIVELSPEMIALARGRAGNTERVVFRREDVRRLQWPEAHFDAIVTNFFLDCFTEDDARALIRKLAGALVPGGIWLIGEFAVPSRGWRKFLARIWVRTMYLFFRLTTGLRVQNLPGIEAFMREAGMCREMQETKRAGLMTSQVWRRAH
jgi:SAM-dependent methyltransferase